MNNAALNRLSDDLLVTMRRRPGNFYRADALARKHHCQESDIIGALDILRQTGYKIVSDNKASYAIKKFPDLLLSAEIANRLPTKMIGRKIYSYKTLQSTNKTASQLVRVNPPSPEGTIVVSEEQTRGRGRMGRVWESLSHKGIYLSIILYPKINPVDAPGLSLVTALALADTLASYDELEVKIKWPNDCLINGRKVAGILTELSAEVGVVHSLVVGVGINVNHRRLDFPPELKSKATSLRAELKKEVNRVDLLQRFLVQFEKRYLAFQKKGFRSQRKKLLQYSNLIGEKISLDMKGEIYTGRAIDINERGELVVDIGLSADGEGPIINFNAGEVTIIKK